MSEHLFDARNRLVRLRQYTGRWDADEPTTEAELLQGPSTPKLRAADPDSYETTWAYDDDSRLVQVQHPRGNEETYAYDPANPSRRSRAISSCAAGW